MGYGINSRFSWKKLAAGCVILDLEKGSYFTLNETAAVVWDGLMGGREEPEIAASLAEDYEVTLEQAKADVGGTISMLVQEGVLEARQRPTTATKCTEEKR
jgi:hypothetical protein